ncbi:unnamed protein product [Cuscuta europaea]|uniref:CCHC-type domain-containing protein n=1 Tax=Cuscuta europaea TaxID=41803 RepID=A0A9P0ZTK6_CUSEU|nr:unnamed protein product [Cuscuta europaea]
MGSFRAKRRRRICYVCREHGHESSSCPMKQAAEQGTQVGVTKSIFSEIYCQDAVTKSISTEMSTQSKSFDDSNFTRLNNAQVSNQLDAVPNAAVEICKVRAKIRRRKCFECGERGHVSSSCPKKQAMEQGNQLVLTKSRSTEINSQAKSVNDSNAMLSHYYKAGLPEVYNHVVFLPNNAVERWRFRTKRRWRICYVCRERGHESSSCSMKQAAEQGNQVGVTKSLFSEINSQVAETKSRSTEMSTQSMSSDDSNFTRLNNVQVSKQLDALPSTPVQIGQLSAKKRRRTCFECGECGHVSSSCPKKQATEQGNQFAFTKSRSTEINTQEKSVDDSYAILSHYFKARLPVVYTHVVFPPNNVVENVEMGPFRAKRRRRICYVHSMS